VLTAILLRPPAAALQAKVVLLVKEHVKCRTLAIGDGANDVPMIQAASIGAVPRAPRGWCTHGPHADSLVGRATAM